MEKINELNQLIQQGRAKKACELIREALAEGITAGQILNGGMLPAMNEVGTKFKNDEIYIPEVLVSARAMNMGMEILKPYMAESGVEPIGCAVIGTVKGDMHDIGKNLVKMMIEGKGINVIDLGVDVPPERFLAAAEENNANVICCSALLTTTMGEMKKVVSYLQEQGVRDKYKVMVGGAPISQSYCDAIGADCYTPDAASAAEAAYRLCVGE